METVKMCCVRMEGTKILSITRVQLVSIPPQRGWLNVELRA